MSKEAPRGVSRRNFLKIAAIFPLAMAACDILSGPTIEPIDQESKEMIQRFMADLGAAPQRYPPDSQLIANDFVSIRGKIERLLKLASLGEISLFISRHTDQRYRTIPTDPDFQTISHVGTDGKFVIQIVWGSSADAPKFTPITDEGGLFHEFLHALEDLKIYEQARQEAENGNGSVKDNYLKLEGAVRLPTSPERQLSSRGKDGQDSQDTSYINSTELKILASEAAFLSGFNQNKRTKESALNPRSQGSDNITVFLRLYQQYQSTEGVAQSLEWRWFQERIQAIYRLHNMVPGKKKIFLTVKDAEISRDFYNWVNNPTNKIIFPPEEGNWQNKFPKNEWDPTENNPLFNGLF